MKNLLHFVIILFASSLFLISCESSKKSKYSSRIKKIQSTKLANTLVTKHTTKYKDEIKKETKKEIPPPKKIVKKVVKKSKINKPEGNELGEKYTNQILGTWHLDTISVGSVTIPASVIGEEALLQFTKNGQLTATSGEVQHINKFNIVDNQIASTSIENNEVQLISIAFISQKKLVLEIMADDMLSRLVFSPSL